MKIQFAEKVHDFEPFEAADSGYITNVFKYVINKLLTENFPQHITIIFINDGDEKFDLTEIQRMIEEVQKKILNIIYFYFNRKLVSKYYIQSIKKFTSQYKFYRTSTIKILKEQMKKSLIFLTLKTKMYQDLFETDVEAKLTLVSKSTHLLLAGAFFLFEIEVTINGQIIKPTNNIFDKKKIVFDSVSQAIIIFGGDPDNAIQERIEEKFQEVQKFGRDIGVEEYNQQNLYYQLTEQEQIIQIQFKNAQLIVNQFAGDVDIDQCTLETLIGLQASLSSPAADSSLIIQIISQLLSVKEDFSNLNPQNILKTQKKKPQLVWMLSQSISQNEIN
ncbi:unnamed protein product [Paramecium sonneborni]|uniref:Uncharacterized protein n=1 Tax=Paramecium sonneborni TaxID=65129 RepID=A0A8S1RLD0_9CILI|nr:unnamed protein product [Paramecium sonneborni]